MSLDDDEYEYMGASSSRGAGEGYDYTGPAREYGDGGTDTYLAGYDSFGDEREAGEGYGADVSSGVDYGAGEDDLHRTVGGEGW
ncbi:MAG: hypothetical protein UHD09_03135 [Bifidobacterium sp.]|nr:hypothetical protein [Bifidobacterium sp.]